MKNALVGMALAAMLLASGCGSGLPAEVEEARYESVEAADAEYDAAIATIEAEYGEARAEANKAHTDAMKDLGIAFAKEARAEAIAEAEQAKVERIEAAEKRAADAARQITAEAAIEKFNADMLALQERFLQEEGGDDLQTTYRHARVAYDEAKQRALDEVERAYNEVVYPSSGQSSSEAEINAAYQTYQQAKLAIQRNTAPSVAPYYKAFDAAEAAYNDAFEAFYERHADEYAAVEAAYHDTIAKLYD